MPPKVQIKSTYKHKVKLYLQQLERLLIKHKTPNSNAYKDGIKLDLERLKQ